MSYSEWCKLIWRLFCHPLKDWWSCSSYFWGDYCIKLLETISVTLSGSPNLCNLEATPTRLKCAYEGTKSLPYVRTAPVFEKLDKLWVWTILVMGDFLNDSFIFFNFEIVIELSSIFLDFMLILFLASKKSLLYLMSEALDRRVFTSHSFCMLPTSKRAPTLLIFCFA